MQKFSQTIQIPLLLLFLIFTTTCNTQIPENNNSPIKPSSNTELPKNIEVSHSPPRIDSILQFSVMITSILEDSKGNFWFGSHGDGLCLYNPSLNDSGDRGKQYTYFTVNHGLPNGIVREFAPGPDWSATRNINGGNQIGQIQEDKNGDICILTEGEMFSKFDGQVFNTIDPEEKSILSTNQSKKEWETALDDMWISPWAKLGVYRYDGNKLVHLIFPPPYSSVSGVSEIYKDNEGSIWFGTMDYGTFRYDGQSFIRINKEDEIGICRVVFQDRSGRIWIGNNRFSLNYLENDTLTNFTKEHSSKEFQSGVQSIEQGKNGDLWIGTFSDGLWRYRDEKLTHFTSDNSLPIITAKSIYKDKSGKLWFGIGEGSVYGFDGESFYRFDKKSSN